MASPKSQAIYAAEGTPITNSFEQESSHDSSEAGTQPVTPELGQTTNWSSFGQPTPDTSPESINTAPSHRNKTPVRRGCQRDVGIVTTSILSKTPSTEEDADTTSICHYSRYLINSKPNEEIADHNDRCSHYSSDSEVSKEGSTASCLDQKKGSSSVVSIYKSVIGLFNLARQRNSRADNARVQDAIRLIKSLPTIRRTRVTNPTRTLTPSQYEQLLVRIQDNKDFSDKLRFEYTHSTQKFEIRMTSALHEGIVGEFTERFGAWKAELRKSNDSRISDAVETIRPHGNKHIKPLALKGARDARSPDGGIKHNCSLECRNPALVFEVEFSNNSKKELKDKAEAYIVRSNGEIRTVIAVYMGEMHTAERKNERRLRKMYRTGQVNESGSYSYSTDEKNVTGEASILVWRATAQKNNTIAIGRVQEKKFRDTAGNVIRSVLLRIPLEDCVCKGLIDSVKRSGAPPLEISSEALCTAIDMDLRDYRNERADEIREEVQLEKEKKRNEEEQENRREEERLRRATEVRMHEDVGVFGRVIEQGRLFSARIRDRRLRRGLG